MSEIKETNKRVAKIMPGTDYKTGDLKAYDLQNTIIAGRSGSGVLTLVNGIISNLVQSYSYSDVGIEYYPLDMERNPWLNPTRQLPHFSTQRYVSSLRMNHKPEDFSELFTRLGEVLSIVIDRQYSFEKGKHKEYVIILELSPAMFIDSDIKDDPLRNNGFTMAGGENWHMLNTLMSVCEDAGIYVVLVDMCDVFGLQCLVDNCSLRLTTRLDEKLSNQIMGCNLSAVEDDKAGFVWVSHKDDRYTKTRLGVKFLPDTYISKFCKLMSVQNKFVGDDYTEMSSRLETWSEAEIRHITSQIRSLSHETDEGNYPLCGLSDLSKGRMLRRLQDVFRGSCCLGGSPRN